MRSNRMMVGVGTVVVLALGGLAVSPSDAGSGHAAHPAPAGGEAVRAWNEIAVNTLIALPGPAGGAPPAAAVHVGMVQGAVFDAVNAIGPRRFHSYLLTRRFPSAASTDAAVAAAAHGVLHGIVSTAPNIPDDTRTATLATLAAAYDDALAAVPDGWSEDKGVAAGEAAAAAMLANRADDGRFGPSQYVPDPTPEPGEWSPLLDPATQQPLLDPTGWVGNVRPFALTSPSQFRTPGPLRLGGARYAAEVNEVKALGSATSTERTPTQTYIAKWWQSTPVRSWNEVARDLAMRHDLGALHTARLLALQNFSGADASINCWNDKYYWNFWRPWNAIRRAAEDGNEATVADPAWTPLISAPYPEHPSGHLCQDGANVRSLRMYFGDTSPGGYSITSVSALLAAGEPTVRHFDSFKQALDEVVEARIWAGLHFRTGDRQAKQLGLNVAKYVWKEELQPLCHHDH